MSTFASGRIQDVIVLGGGSAGFMSAAALKVKLPHLRVRVIRSRAIGVIGVGEGSTVALTNFVHDFLKVGLKRFHDIAQPTWKLGLRFVGWGPRPWFHYPFSAGLVSRQPALPKVNGQYCDAEMSYEDPISAMMSHDRVFERGPGGGPVFHNAISYHFENEKFVAFLEQYAAAQGVEIVDDTVVEARAGEAGIASLALACGGLVSADLYLDASGFHCELIGKTLGEPFIDFRSSLFCDRAVVGGWNRDAEPIKPYTTCDAMEAGWAWRIEHEERINRGYVYASSFSSDEEAEREFRQRNPKVQSTRLVKFRAGRSQRGWVGNVVAIGNASGFVEPLEATALGMIAQQSKLLAATLIDSDGQPGPAAVGQFNSYHARLWEDIRAFIAVHYRFSTARDTPFWRACRAETDLGMAGPIVEVYRETGPSTHWEPTLFDPFDPFRMIGYATILAGLKVPYRRTYQPSDRELKLWEEWRQKNRQAAMKAMTVADALAVIRSPRWKWD